MAEGEQNDPVPGSGGSVGQPTGAQLPPQDAPPTAAPGGGPMPGPPPMPSPDLGALAPGRAEAKRTTSSVTGRRSAGPSLRSESTACTSSTSWSGACATICGESNFSMPPLSSRGGSGPARTPRGADAIVPTGRRPHGRPQAHDRGLPRSRHLAGVGRNRTRHRGNHRLRVVGQRSSKTRSRRGWRGVRTVTDLPSLRPSGART